jgi:hypothetical protein
MSKTAAEIEEALLIAWGVKKPKPKPEAKVEVVAENPGHAAESVRVGLARSLGETLAKIDSELPPGTRFARAVRIDTEGMYWREVDRLFNPQPSVTVRFEYHPLQAFDESIPEFNRRKG